MMMVMSIPQLWKLVVNERKGSRLVVLFVLSISKAKTLEVAIRGASGRPSTYVSPIIFKVDAGAHKGHTTL